MPLLGDTHGLDAPDVILGGGLGVVEVDRSLQVQPELSGVAEETGEPKRHLWADCPALTQQLVDGLPRDAEQLSIARARAEAASEKLGKSLGTRIEALKKFWPAEDYHQKYYLRSDRTLMAQLRGMYGSDELALRDSTAAMRVNGYLSGVGTRARLNGEIESFGLTEDARTHLESLVGDVASGASCALP